MNLDHHETNQNNEDDQQEDEYDPNTRKEFEKAINQEFF